MSVVNVFLLADAAHLLTDAATYDDDGVMHSFGSKVSEIAGMRAAVTSRGWSGGNSIFAELVAGRFASFDALAASFEADAAALLSRVRGLRGDDPRIDCYEVYLAGWSEAADAPKAFVISGRNEPGRLRPIEQYWLAPIPTDAALIESGGLDMAGKAFSPDIHGVIIMEAQRRCRFPSLTSGKLIIGCGGFAEHTAVTRDGVTRRILKRWPEDRIGETIVPAPAGELAARRSRKERRASSAVRARQAAA